MKTKDKIIIIRLTEEEANAVKELRRKFSINISGLVRLYLKGYYENEVRLSNQKSVEQ